MRLNSEVNPTVSICVPTLNMRKFLAERFATIFNQTFQDWELLVYDSHSDDGSWEYIQELAAKDGRMRVWQGPREGVYPAWNECVRQAKGEYVYIATSDDTMSADCLQKLAAALERHSECDLAHCPLVVIDEMGKLLPERPPWPNGTVFGLGMMERLDHPHIRRAPYDGLLHLTQMHAFLSITQLLIRRSLFSRTGMFQSTWGSVSDFNWEMKAGLIANVVHVPDTWATWRQHSLQLSSSIDIRSVERDRKFDDMILDAVKTCEAELHPAVAAGLKTRWLSRAQIMRGYYSGLRRRPLWYRRRIFQLHQLFFGPLCVRAEILMRFRGDSKWGDRLPVEIRVWLESLGLDPVASIDRGVSAKIISNDGTKSSAE
jgi:glycosyltransferase involved in cell wall biosynthesis